MKLLLTRKQFETIDNRLRNVEVDVAEMKGRKAGWESARKESQWQSLCGSNRTTYGIKENTRMKLIDNRKFLLGMLVFGVLIACTQTSAQIAEKAKNSIVWLIPEDADKKIISGGGSGFFVEHDMIATNIHVVASAAKVHARQINTETWYTIKEVTAFDPKNDIVILKIAEKGVKLPIGDSTAVIPGEQIITIGNPEGKIKITYGTIHSIRNSDKMFRLKAKIGAGESGGPVLNNNSEVIGVMVQAASDGIGYAIPSKKLNELLSYTEVQNLSEWNDIPQIRAYAHLVQATIKYKDGQNSAEKKDLDEALGQYTAAEEELREATRLYKFAAAYKLLGHVNSERAGVYKLLGDVSKKQEQYQKAIDAYKMARKLMPDCVRAHAGLAEIRLSLGDYEKAIADLTKIIKAYPKEHSEDHYNRRGGAYFELGNAIDNTDNVKGKLSYYEKALNDFTQAIELDPDNNTAQDFTNRGVVWYVMGEATYETVHYRDYYEEALSDFQKALKLENNVQKQKVIRQDILGIKEFLERSDW